MITETCQFCGTPFGERIGVCCDARQNMLNAVKSFNSQTITRPVDTTDEQDEIAYQQFKRFMKRYEDEQIFG